MVALTDSETIDAAGGTVAVSKLCGVNPGAVSQWRQDGIPAARRFQIAKALEAAGKTVPKGFFERSIPERRARPA